MKSSVKLAGATYADVEQVNIPTSAGGKATYTNVSDSTATAADVAQGKIFYTSGGTKTTGTATTYADYDEVSF